MSPFFKNSTQIQAIIALRSIGVVIKLLLICFVNFGLAYQLPWAPLLSVISIEICFTLISYLYYQKHHVSDKRTTQKAILLQISADIILLSLLLFFSGGATNAFVSLLLIPIAIAAVTLTPKLLAVVAILAITSYSILLWSLPMSVMHGNMQGHFIGMGINFLFSALVVAIVVGKMARSINKQELSIAAYRENLLKQEQVTSIGVASAQVTHQLATPIATVQLLADELSEELPESEIVADMQSQLSRCKKSLTDFRTMVLDIKDHVVKELDCHDFFTEVIDNVRVNNPSAILNIKALINQSKHLTIYADAALLPAILNLINNAIRASKANDSNHIDITNQIAGNNWQLIIRDYGKGFSLQKLNKLGVKPVNSAQGLGMAVFLSHASLENLGGKLALTNHVNGGALVTLSIPLSNPSDSVHGV